MPSAAPIAVGVMMPRSSNSRPIAMRSRIVVSRSSCRMRRSSADTFGFSGGDGGDWSGGRLMPCEVVALVAGVTPARRASRSPCDDPHRWVTAARRAGADAETGRDEVDPELPALQLAGDGPAAGHRLPAPAGDPGFQP